LIKDAYHTNSVKDKFRIWFMPTGWRPADVEARFPDNKIEDPYDFEKYAPKISKPMFIWIWFQFLFTFGMLFYFYGNIGKLGVPNMFVYGANVSITGEREFFTSNNRVLSVSGNNVTLANAVFGNVASGLVLDFGTSIVYNSNTANNYLRDTVLVTRGRLANSSFGNTARSSAVAHAGWVYTTTGTGGRAGRVQTEVLVALANTSASNTASGNTSNSQTFYSGL
jgi:hypothetical protein